VTLHTISIHHNKTTQQSDKNRGCENSKRTYRYGQFQVAEILFCKTLSGYVMEKNKYSQISPGYEADMKSL
jgi:hypothetical protein